MARQCHKRLTSRLLDAIIQMASRVEAGGVEMYRGYDGPKDHAAYDAAIDAGMWARRIRRNRRASKADA